MITIGRKKEASYDAKRIQSFSESGMSSEIYEE